MDASEADSGDSHVDEEDDYELFCDADDAIDTHIEEDALSAGPVDGGVFTEAGSDGDDMIDTHIEDDTLSIGPVDGGIFIAAPAGNRDICSLLHMPQTAHINHDCEMT